MEDSKTISCKYIGHQRDQAYLELVCAIETKFRLQEASNEADKKYEECRSRFNSLNQLLKTEFGFDHVLQSRHAHQVFVSKEEHDKKVAEEARAAQEAHQKLEGVLDSTLGSNGFTMVDGVWTPKS